MRMRHAAVLAGLVLGLMSGAAKAAYVVNIEQSGADVVATGMGSLDLSQLSYQLSYSDPYSYVYGPQATLLLGQGSEDIYSGQGNIIGPTTFGSGPFTTASSTTGDFVGVRGSGGGATPYFYVPRGYVTNTNISSSATFANQTLASLGFIPGESFQFVAPGADTLVPFFTINVASMSPVPLPASAPLFGAALLALGAVGYGLKRKKAAAAA